MTLWGELSLDGARRTLTIEHEFAASRQQLWSAIVEPVRLARWIGAVTTQGDEFTLEFPDGGPAAHGRILACEPESHLVALWTYAAEAPSELELNLHARDDAHTTLTLTHRGLQGVAASGYGASWEDFLVALGAELGEQLVSDGFAQALDAYRQREVALVPASITRAGGLSGVHLERMLEASPAEVWSAMTMPDRIGRWLWPVVSWPDDPERQRSLRLGDRFALGDANVPEGLQTLVVLALEPERLLSFTWGPNGAAVTITLEPREEGTLFILDQDAIPDVFGAGRLRSAADFAAGWHSLVDGLSLLLDGLEVPHPESLWDSAYTVYRSAP